MIKFLFFICFNILIGIASSNEVPNTYKGISLHYGLRPLFPYDSLNSERGYLNYNLVKTASFIYTQTFSTKKKIQIDAGFGLNYRSYTSAYVNIQNKNPSQASDLYHTFSTVGLQNRISLSTRIWEHKKFFSEFKLGITSVGILKSAEKRTSNQYAESSALVRDSIVIFSSANPQFHMNIFFIINLFHKKSGLGIGLKRTSSSLNDYTGISYAVYDNHHYMNQAKYTGIVKDLRGTWEFILGYRFVR